MRRILASGNLRTLRCFAHANGLIAFDYDGTLATDGVVDEKTIESLHCLRESGRKLVLVTGRIIEQLLHIFPQIGLCNLVVADNGAVLYDPQTREVTELADPPPDGGAVRVYLPDTGDDGATAEDALLKTLRANGFAGQWPRGEAGPRRPRD